MLSLGDLTNLLVPLVATLSLCNVLYLCINTLQHFIIITGMATYGGMWTASSISQQMILSHHKVNYEVRATCIRSYTLYMLSGRNGDLRKRS